MRQLNFAAAPNYVQEFREVQRLFRQDLNVPMQAMIRDLLEQAMHDTVSNQVQAGWHERAHLVALRESKEPLWGDAVYVPVMAVLNGSEVMARHIIGQIITDKLANKTGGDQPGQPSSFRLTAKGRELLDAENQEAAAAAESTAA